MLKWQIKQFGRNFDESERALRKLNVTLHISNITCINHLTCHYVYNYVYKCAQTQSSKSQVQKGTTCMVESISNAFISLEIHITCKCECI